MNKLTLLAVTLLLLMNMGAARDPFYDSATVLKPYNFHLNTGYSVMPEVIRNHGYAYVPFSNDSGSGSIPDCGLAKFKFYLEWQYHRAIFFVETHGSEYASTYEAYTNETDRDNAYEFHLDNGWNEYQIWKSQSAGGYGIAVNPETVNYLFDGGNEELVVYRACWSQFWLESGYQDARCLVACVDTCCTVSDFETLFGALDGRNGIDNRQVGNAIILAPNLAQFKNGETVLSPVLLEVEPQNGGVIYEDTPGWVRFDSDMLDDLTDRAPVVANGRAVLRDIDVRGDEIEFIIHPYDPGDVTIMVTDEALSRGGKPFDADGIGPNGGEYEFSVYADVPDDPNTACGFEGAWAWEEVNGTHVCWSTDPELGSQYFTVYAGKSRDRVVGVVPAEGGPDWPHYYEVVDPVGADAYEVVETDDDPDTEYSTRPFNRSSVPPANLELLRTTNTLPRPLPVMQDPNAQGGGGPYSPADIVFYSSRGDFLDACDPVIQWWEDQGWVCKKILGSEDPYECRNVMRGVFESCVNADWRRRPLLVIVGEANEGLEPEKNKVGTTYHPDNEYDDCYWSSCASDLAITDFYGDGPEVLPYRVAAYQLFEVENAVQSAMEYYNGVNIPNPGVLALVGDRGSLCNITDEPRLTFNEIGGWFEDAGISYLPIRDSDFDDCNSYGERLDAFVANAYRQEWIGTGRTTNRNIWPGYIVQRVYDPIFDMSYLPVKKRIVAEFVGCGLGDGDRNNPSYYPGLAKMVTVADPDEGASVVLLLGNSRGGPEALYLEFAREYFQERLMAEDLSLVGDIYLRVIRRLWHTQPSMRDFLSRAMTYGLPVWLPDMLHPSSAPETAARAVLRMSLGPNPATTSGTTISYTLPGLSRVDLGVFDPQGRRIATLVDNEIQDPGDYRVSWRDRSLAAGVYFVRLTTSTSSVSQKLVYLK
ncbi:MAG: T9SS type A sorting domain-containing protein [bacterium]|nr:T9SS type A sorting domain-containing protein [bacterium]